MIERRIRDAKVYEVEVDDLFIGERFAKRGSGVMSTPMRSAYLAREVEPTDEEREQIEAGERVTKAITALAKDS